MNIHKIIALISKPFMVRYKRWYRKSTLTKRQLLVLITIVLTIGLIATQLASPDSRYLFVFALACLTYLLSAFGLREELSGIEWITLLMLPTLYTAAIALFYFLLPTRWLTRIPIAFMYAIGIYALLLTENIYNVAANRTIALLRAAHTVGFLLTLVTFFLFVQTILSWQSYAWTNSFSTFGITFLLSVQSLWAITLENKLTSKTIHLSIAISVAIGELAWILSFWPVNMTIQALFLTTCFYGVLGMAQQYLQEKLYKKTLIEFVTVIGIVFLIVLYATHWRGNS
jgi:hypothetical protein